MAVAHTQTFLGDAGMGLLGGNSSSTKLFRSYSKGHHTEGEEVKGTLGKKGMEKGPYVPR